jgi:hypothetical protein
VSGAFTVGESRGIVSQPLAGSAVALSSFSAGMMTSYSIRIPGANNRPMVTIHPDGRIELGEDCDLDEAAREFWAAVKRVTPDPAVQTFGAPLKARIDRELARGQAAEGLLRKALAMYEDVVEGRVDGNAIVMLAGAIRGFLNTPEPS